MNRLIILPLLIIFLAGCVTEQQQEKNEPYKNGCKFPSFTWGKLDYPGSERSGNITLYGVEAIQNGNAKLYFTSLPASLGNGWYIDYQNPKIWTSYNMECHAGKATGENIQYAYCTGVGNSTPLIIYTNEIQNVADDGTILEPTKAQRFEIGSKPLIVFDLSKALTAPKEPFAISTLPIVKTICD